MAASDPTTGVPTPTGTLQGVAAFSWDGSVWQPAGRAGPSVATPTGVLRGVAAFNGGPAWQPSGRAQPGVATPTGVLDGVAVYTWSGSAWTPPGGQPAPSTSSGALRGVAAFNWDGAAWQPAGRAGPSVATPYGVLDGVAMFGWTGSAWAAVAAPSLSLDFMSGALDARITFARASTATYFNSSGTMTTAATNAPRWDYDPTTHALKGLRIENAAQNVLLQSANFAVSWTANAATVATAAGVAPDGTTTMNRMAEVASTSIFFLSQSVTIAASTLYTLSLYAKAAENRYLQLGLDNAGADGGFATFDLQTGTISGALTARGAGVVGTASIQPVGNGVYRCAITTTIGASTGARLLIILANAAAPAFAPSYAGNAANGLLIWGAQLESGGAASSYVPTTTAAVTRAADLASMPTGAWFNATNGTWQAECIPNGNAAALPAIISGNAGSPTIGIYADSRLSSAIRGVVQVFLSTGPLFNFGAVNKAAFGYLSGASWAAVNGTAFGPNATAFAVTGTVVEFGSDGVTPGTFALDGWLRSARYWPRVLSSAELQSVTT